MTKAKISQQRHKDTEGRNSRRRIFLRASVSLWFFLGAFAHAADQPQVKAEPRSEDFMVSMRDGVKLATTAYFPEGQGPWPVVLFRTPYNKNSNKGGAKGFTERGYVMVAQDCRGRYKSEGEYVPFRTDREDGYDAVEWCAAQKWSNGKVGMSGGSALGITTNLAATAAPPHLVAGYVVVAPASWRRQALWVGALYRKELMDNWMEAQKSTEVRKEWQAKAIMDPYWDWAEIADQHKAIQIPMYNVGGWFDIFDQGTVENFVGLQAHGGGRAKGNQKLLMAAAGHGAIGPRLKYPKDAGDLRGDDQYRWFDYWLKGIDNGIMKEPPIQYYLMGDPETPGAPGNQWQTANSWPPKTKTASYYLIGDNKLSTERPKEKNSASRYVYDPANPVKTYGGPNLTIAKGPMDQRPIGERPDYLRFNSDLLAEPVTVVGQVSVELYVQTDAPDTDFMAKLVDVYPDGYEALILDNGLRVRYRKGLDKEVTMTPDKIEKIEIDLWSTANVFAKGHRIGVHVTSSNDTRFEPNPNTGHPFRADAESRKANNAVWHDAKHRSRILLPVMSEMRQ